MKLYKARLANEAEKEQIDACIWNEGDYGSVSTNFASHHVTKVNEFPSNAADRQDSQVVTSFPCGATGRNGKS